MKPESESYAWQQLEERAAAHLRAGFANRVLCAARPPGDRVWVELEEHAVTQLEAGFADRVLRAVRAALPAEIPSLFSQFALSAATAAVCLIAVVYVHDRTTRLEDERNLASWRQLAADTQDIDLSP
jgi:hypothetical protein